MLRRASKLGLGLLLAAVAMWISTPLWSSAVARSLTCREDVAPSDAILLENFDPYFAVFERAAALEKAGLARKVFVPVEVAGEPGVPNLVSVGIAEVMARYARLGAWRAIPIAHVEPIGLNAALQIRERLAREEIRSVIVVSPSFRSRRSSLVYRATLGPAGITVRCAPASRPGAGEAWTASWHGIQQVIEELLKLQYYRFYVLPFRGPAAGT